MIENLTINWLSRYAGIDDCFAFSEVNYNDPDGIPRIGSTADVCNAFFVAHLLGKDDAIIISDTTYSQLKVVNKNQDINLDDVAYVYSITDYCYIDCLEIVCQNKCVGYDLYSQRCENDTCFVDELLEVNNVEICGYDPCEGVVCNDYCDGTTLYHNGICVNGECVYDVETNSVACGYVPPDPCEGVVCNDYCDGTTRYYNGSCVEGECVYNIEIKSEVCGYEPPIEPSESSTPWWLLGLLLLLKKKDKDKKNKE